MEVWKTNVFLEELNFVFTQTVVNVNLLSK